MLTLGIFTASFFSCSPSSRSGTTICLLLFLVISQIRERAEWIAEMEDLGHAGPHREIIREQIAERIRALDALGVDGECSSVRSGFSTLRSREAVGDTGTPKHSGRSDKSTKSKASVGKKVDSAKSGKLFYTLFVMLLLTFANKFIIVILQYAPIY